MKKSVLIAVTMLVMAFVATAQVQAANNDFVNGWAPSDWQGLSNGVVPYPNPAPFVVIGGVKYRIGDKGVQFHRFATGGVRVILGSCSAKNATHISALELYQNGVFSELLRCAAASENS